MTSSTTDSPSSQNTVPARSRVGLWLGPMVFFLMLAFVELDPANPSCYPDGGGHSLDGDLVDDRGDSTGGDCAAANPVVSIPGYYAW